MKGYSITEVIEAIEINLNETYNRNIGTTPSQAMGYKALVDPTDMERTVDLVKIYKRSLKAAEQELQKRNQKRKTKTEFQINDLVLVSNLIKSKLDARFIGPYRIVDIGQNSNRIKIKVENFERWINIKRLKLFRKGRQDDVESIVGIKVEVPESK